MSNRLLNQFQEPTYTFLTPLNRGFMPVEGRRVGRIFEWSNPSKSPDLRHLSHQLMAQV